MKTRIGFVSNSSSSSYIIAITRDFKITDEMAKHIFETFDEYKFAKIEIPQTIEDVKKILSKSIDQLCQGEGYFWQEEGYPLLTFELLSECKNQIEIASMDSGSGDGKLINCLSDNYKEKTIKKLKTIIEGTK